MWLRSRRKFLLQMVITPIYDKGGFRGIPEASVEISKD